MKPEIIVDPPARREEGVSQSVNGKEMHPGAAIEAKPLEFVEPSQAREEAELIFDPWETYIVPDFPLQTLPDVRTALRCGPEPSDRVRPLGLGNGVSGCASAARSITVSRSR